MNLLMQDTSLFDGEHAQMLIRLALNRIRLQKKKKTEANEGRLSATSFTVQVLKEKWPG